MHTGTQMESIAARLFVRGRPAQAAALVATWVTVLAGAGLAHANPPRITFSSEIITPAGWETSDAQQQCRALELSTSRELVTPRGWSAREAREAPSWGGCVCSDLVVPAEWQAAVSTTPKRR